MRPSPPPNPSAPSAEPPSVTACGGSRSDSFTSARYRPFTGPMPMRHVGAEMRVGDFLERCGSRESTACKRRGIEQHGPDPLGGRANHGFAFAAQTAGRRYACASARRRDPPAAPARRRARCARVSPAPAATRCPSHPSASATALAMQTGVDMQLPSPTPFDAQRRERRRRLHVQDERIRHLRRGRQQIVGEGSGQETAVGGIGVFLVERGADAPARSRRESARRPWPDAGSCRNRAW